MERVYNPEFRYTHKNPYHDKLEEFSQFVLRDNEAESWAGRWQSEIFANNQNVVTEIGTGNGKFMMEYCQDHPEHNFIGMDYRFKRSFHLAKKLSSLGLNNFRYLRARGERLQFMFGESEVSDIFYFFPDPWPKKRHNKKRLFQQPFLEQAYKVLKPGGVLWVKTDHDGYAEWMQEVINQQKLFQLDLATKDLRNEFPDSFLARYTTKFESIFLEQGTKIKGFVLRSLKS
jgi:tRNA (guanine-N7-)-methyltransferase